MPPHNLADSKEVPASPGPDLLAPAADHGAHLPLHEQEPPQEPRPPRLDQEPRPPRLDQGIRPLD